MRSSSSPHQLWYKLTVRLSILISPSPKITNTEYLITTRPTLMKVWVFTSTPKNQYNTALNLRAGLGYFYWSVIHR